MNSDFFKRVKDNWDLAIVQTSIVIGFSLLIGATIYGNIQLQKDMKNPALKELAKKRQRFEIDAFEYNWKKDSVLNAQRNKIR